MTCDHCGSPWFEPNTRRKITCTDCGTPIGGTR